MAIPLRRQDAPVRRSIGAPATKKPAPKLTIAPRRRRWPAALAAIAMLLVLGAMLGAAVFHTQLAERQMRIDKLERAVNDERERFDELRYQRAELRSPVRLATEAERLGMARGDTGRFVEVDPWLLARQIAAAGAIDADQRQIIIDTDPLDQFSDVKRVSAGQP